MKLRISVLAIVLSAALTISWSGLFAQTNRAESWGDASWIWDSPGANSNPQSDDPRYFRQKFTLAETPTKAQLWVTADNTYTAYVNGKKVGSGSEWAKVDKYEVAKLLVKGPNVVAIEAKNQGGVAGMIARLWVETADKKDMLVTTGAGTKATQSAGNDWTQAGHDDSKWLAASVLGDATLAPWGGGAVAAGPKGKSSDVSSDGKINKHLSAKDEQKEFTLPKGFEIELVALEPTIINPVTLAVDGKGRLLVSESHTYRFGPSGSPVKPYRNPVIRLEPKPQGGFERVLVADGFEDPAMGIAVKDGKLWIAANEFLYQYDYPESGPATNKKLLVKDKNKAWNPFGDFVLENGPDGLLYMSVGNHNIVLEGPNNKVESRGGSGIIVRMNPDGTNMERLVQGLRVPYSFEFDPFGELWVLSNGEGNPNRFVKVIPGVDYHCYSRGKVDNNWLAGNHPLAPPCFELPRGAHTQLMRYYGAAYPPEYTGSLLLDNWGAHGFHGPNRAVFRYVPDERGQIKLKEPFVSCNDPHFRPAHIVLDNDGNLLIADWYGRDDESDMTGRIWRVKYTGKVEPVARLGANPTEKELLAALGSRSHIDREKAMDALVARGDVETLRITAQVAENPLEAAGALWCLTRIRGGEPDVAVLDGTLNSDPRVRRLALDLARRFAQPASEKRRVSTARKFLEDRDPAVRLEAATVLGDAASLVGVIGGEVAKDPHLRYRAAATLAKFATADDFAKLLKSPESDIRLAGFIALDVACWENHPTRKAALAALTDVVGVADAADLAHVVFLIGQHGDTTMLQHLEKLAMRDDVPPTVTGKAMLAYRGIVGKLPPAAGKRFLEGVQKGTIALNNTADQLAVFELLETEGPTAFAIDHLGKAIRANNPQVKPAALALARRFGPKTAAVADSIWPSVLNPKSKSEETLDGLATLARIQSPAPVEPWTKLLHHADPVVRTDAVRWFRAFKDQPELTKVLAAQAPDLVKEDADLQDDLGTVLREVGLSSPAASDDGKRDKAQLAKTTTELLGKWSQAEKTKHAQLGKSVFERALCTKCHTTVTQNTPLAPSLKGVGAQKLDYLVESILEPSKVIKTGFETEVLTTTAGKTLSGLVKDEGTHYRVQNADLDVRVSKKDVEERTVQKRSIMPDGQEALLSRREFVDLIAYLSTLK